MSGNTTEVECGDVPSIEELLPNGYDDLERLIKDDIGGFL